MGYGTMTPETRYATARRLLRDAEERAERLEADLSRVRGEFDAMEGRAKAAERSRDALREALERIASLPCVLPNPCIPSDPRPCARCIAGFALSAARERAS